MIINGVDDAAPLLLSVTAPSDGAAPVAAADVQVPVTGLMADAARLAGGRMTPVNVIRHCRQFEYDPAVWQRDGTTGILTQIDVAITDDRKYLWGIIEAPDGASLANVYAVTKHPSVHAGSPGTLPSFTLSKQEPLTGALAGAHGSAAKTYGSSATYGAFGSFGLSGMTGKIMAHAANIWIVRLDGEHGANALAGLQLHTLQFQFTASNRDAGAA